MSKAEINNEIVLMRQVVRQARVRSIRKWVKKSNQLKKKKGNEAQLEKHKRTSERLIAQVLALKSVKDDEITKFALLNNRTLKDLSEDQKLKPKERAIAQVSFFNTLQEKIVEFKQKYPDYQEHLSSNKKNVLKKKSQNKPEKQQSKKKLEEQEESDNDDSSSSEDLAKKFNIKPGSLIRMKPIKNDESDDEEDEDEEEDVDNTIEDDTDEDEDKDVNKTEEDTDDDEEEIQRNKVSKKQKRSDNSPTKSFNSLNTKKSQKEARKRNFEEHEKSKINIGKKKKEKHVNSSPKKDKSNTEKEKQVKPKMDLEKVADPFFMSSDSTPYMAVRAPKSHDHEENVERKKEFSKNPGNISKFGNNKYNKKPYQFGNDKFSNKFNNESFKPGNNKFSNDKFGNKFNDKFPKDKYGNKFDKRNNTFNKNEAGFNQRKNNFKGNESQGSSKQNFAKSPSKQQNLHPSWEAKKKQQDAMKSGFQGKKIIFDE